MAGKGRLWERQVMAAGLVVLALVVLAAGYRLLRVGVGRVCDDFMYPYLRLVRVGSSRLSDQSLLSFSRAELAEKLEALQGQNRNLSLQAAAAGSLLRENAQLRKIARFSPPRQWSALKAEVILRDPAMWRERFTIDRGEADGAVAGAAVIDIASDGRPLLLGVIERVGKRTSTVQTLHNSALRVAARIGPNRAVGFVNTGAAPRGDGTLPVGFLPREVRYISNESVVTTGFERGIPAGIVIGELVSVEEPESRFSDRPYLSGWIKPAADFDNVRFVVIAVPKAAGR